VVSFEKSAVAEKCNNFFTTIATTLVNNLPSTGNFGKHHIYNYCKNKNVTQDSFALSKVDVEDVEDTHFPHFGKGPGHHQFNFKHFQGE